ncbi:MAG: tetratricopeptide repeat protein [Deltaproteobacteria bacterium]|jgi:tetratricopeptide (TPR) repeat protein|nr:tetratricopeptide repeat protein [Deltaproteobacteria bacterium]
MARKPIWSVTFDYPGRLGDDPGAELRDRGDLAGAEAAARRALRENAKARGPGHKDALPLLDSLGITLLCASMFREAVPVLGEALRVSGEQLGRRHEDTLTRLMNLGLAMIRADDPEGALDLFDEAMELKAGPAGQEAGSSGRTAGSEGQEDWQTLTLKEYFGIALAETGRRLDAILVLQEVLDALERLDPPDERLIGMARINLDIASRLRDGGFGSGPNP